MTINAFAQTDGITAKPLLRTTVTGDDAREVIVLTVEFAPGSSTGWHTHPGDEYATVLEGTLEIRGDGVATRTIAAGQAYHNPRGLVHETRNPGTRTVKLVTTFVIDKGASVSTPVRDVKP